MNNKYKRYIIIITIFLVLVFTLQRLLYSNKFLAIVFDDKIWVHRVNSLKKLNELCPSYTGVELDVVFDSLDLIFDVNHPSAKSINLSLEKYLKSSLCKNEIRYWIDFKNLNRNNSEISLKKLNEIIYSLNLNRDLFIIESKSPEQLSIFRKAGYLTSYYLPVELYIKEKDDLDSSINLINGKLKVNNEFLISSNYKDYNILKKSFPARDKLHWFLGGYGKMTKLEARLLLLKILLDEKVKVVLLPFYSKIEER